MTAITLTVNGKGVAADVTPRTHLADFLRETLLLTGTHIGCEQGVCGACTIQLNGEPARSCIIFAALCDGANIRTIEGLSDDALGAALRAAFTAEHALQCGYCTPGMLVTARGIIRRLPNADENRVRLELAGNLCRCTGYNGIVRAILRVIQTNAAATASEPATRITPAETCSLRADRSLPQAVLTTVMVGEGPPPTPLLAVDLESDKGRSGADLGGTSPPPHPTAASPPGTSRGTTSQPPPPATPAGQPTLSPVLRISASADSVWRALQDPALVAACVPGARVTAIDGPRIEGEMTASFGPIHTRFTGEAIVSYNQAARTGRVTGRGSDRATRLSGDASFAVRSDGPSACRLSLAIAFDLRGPLAQFSRASVVEVLAQEIASETARNLAARLRGQTITHRALTLRLFWRALRRWLIGHTRNRTGGRREDGNG